MSETPLGGTVEPGFELVRDAFAANFDKGLEVGASCCAYYRGRQVVDLWGGVTTPGGTEPFTGETLELVWSATKGITTIAAHILAQEGKLDFNAPVVEYWPEFAAEGKDRIPVRWLFCHKAGLAALDRPFGLDDVLDWTRMRDALAAQRPLWEPGSAHGYHTYTFGWLAGEIIRRVSGGTVGEFVAERIAKPLGAEFWIGLPRSENERVAPVIPSGPPAPSPEAERLIARLADPSSLSFRSFAQIPPAAFNEYPWRAAEVPAGNGICTARALARIYAACIGPVDGVTLLDPPTVERATVTQAEGEDLILAYPTQYGTGFQLTHPFRPLGGDGSFGHYGSGGSVGFAHKDLGFSFGYVMNQMRPVPERDPRTWSLIESLLSCVGSPTLQ